MGGVVVRVRDDDGFQAAQSFDLQRNLPMGITSASKTRSYMTQALNNTYHVDRTPIEEREQIPQDVAFRSLEKHGSLTDGKLTKAE